MEALYNLTTIFGSAELKCHIFNLLLYSALLYFIFNLNLGRKKNLIFCFSVVYTQTHYLNFTEKYSIAIPCDCEVATVIVRRKGYKQMLKWSNLLLLPPSFAKRIDSPEDFRFQSGSQLRVRIENVLRNLKYLNETEIARTPNFLVGLCVFFNKTQSKHGIKKLFLPRVYYQGEGRGIGG